MSVQNIQASKRPTSMTHTRSLSMPSRSRTKSSKCANCRSKSAECADHHSCSSYFTTYSSLTAYSGLWGMFYKNAEAQVQGQALIKARMAEFVKDKRLLEGFTPKFGIGCRRVTPGDPYME